ncbi:MAG: uracil-DNA glycosylase [Pelolinea sp.]|nr:uracil-DNA glycosylase [Pelolinea sp.]
MSDIHRNLSELNLEVINCRRCSRLVEWRERIVRTKKRAYFEWDYWGKPVPGLGDINGKILILGLAPGAHGSNRTGRMFTGDASGDFLYPALYDAGFTSQPEALSVNDGLKLKNIYISAVCRCAPPDNKPTREEMANCRPFLDREFTLMRNMVGVVALGKIAFDSALDLIKKQNGINPTNMPKFGHGKLYFSNDRVRPWLLTSYHPSRQNTQTGRLTKKMFKEIWETARKLL